MAKFSRAYVALQNIWTELIHLYNNTFNPETRLAIVDDLINTLVDIEETGKKALYTRYKEWEKNEWNPIIKNRFNEWVDNNKLIADDYKRRTSEIREIKQEENPKRLHKIMQIIQDSGIGLGSGKTRESYELSGFMGESTNQE